MPEMDSASTPNVDEVSSQNVANKNKRKKPQISTVWEHFNINGGDKCECIYCGKCYGCDSKKHGTKSLWNHLDRCPKYILSEEQAENLSIEFDKDAIRRAIGEMIIVDELPFKFFENKGFRRLMRLACPKFECPSRRTIGRDILKLYLSEKERMKSYFRLKKVRVSLTTDIWTSIQNLSYMVIIAHFIDDNWGLQKRILSFAPIENHKGETIGKILASCLLEWGLDRIFSITVDNASENEVAINYLKKKLMGWKGSDLILNGEFMHMRCFAHIINLIVNEGLRDLHDSIARVRNAVRYVRSTPSRFVKFRACVKRERIQYKGNLLLDVPTRWNATYLMLESALQYKKAFERLEEEDGHYTNFLNEESGMGLGPPQFDDWDKVCLFVKILKNFYDITLKVSASLTVTSNIVFQQMWKLQMMLNELKQQRTNLLCDMATNMSRIFDKYCGSLDGFNKILLIAVILDPRYKLRYFTFAWNKIWNAEKAEALTTETKGLLFRLYDIYCAFVDGCPNEDMHCEASNPTTVEHIEDKDDLYSILIKDPNDDFMSDPVMMGSLNEVEMYLSDANIQAQKDKFDVLEWWKQNSVNYPALSGLAKDVFAIPTSTVASELAFSMGGRVLDQFRSSLTPKVLEAVVCSQNWIVSNLWDKDEIFSTSEEPDPNESQEATSGDALGFCTSLELEVMGSTIASIDCLDLDA